MRTGRIIIPIVMIALFVACGTGTRPKRAPAPGGAERASGLTAPATSGISLRMIQVCVVQGGALTNVTAQYNPVTGDTLPGRSDWGMPVPAVAADASWFIHNEPITIQGELYVKHGTPRGWQVGELVRVADHREWPVFAERGGERDPSVVYVPLRSICEFQPYQRAEDASTVRG